MHVRPYTQVSMHTHTYTHAHTNTHTYIFIHTHARARAQACTHAHISIRICMVQQEKYFVLQSISFNTFAGLFQGIPPEIQQIINDYSELV